MSNAQKLAGIFKTLFLDTRVRLVLLLKDKSVCVNSLAARLEVTPAAISQHLRVLRDADLAVAEKRGYYVHYRVNEKTLAAWNKLTNRVLGADAG